MSCSSNDTKVRCWRGTDLVSRALTRRPWVIVEAPECAGGGDSLR